MKADGCMCAQLSSTFRARCIDRPIGSQGSQDLSEHSLNAFNPVTKTVLERCVPLALCDVLGDRGSNYFRDWLIVDVRDRL